MPLAPDSNYIAESALLGSDGAWIWLAEVELGASEVARVALYDSNVTWDSKTWYAYPFSIPEIPEDTDTSARTFRVSFFQVDETLTNYLRDDEIIGNRVTFKLVHADHLSVTTPAISREATILAATITSADGTVTLTCGALNWLEGTLGRRFQRLRCRHIYGGAACGYDTARSGAIATCDRTLNGTNGCVVHGEDESDNGLFPAHPMRFGGEPGIPRSNRG